MVVGCVVSESISAQNQKKSVTDGRTDGQTDKSKTISLRLAGENKNKAGDIRIRPFATDIYP